MQGHQAPDSGTPASAAWARTAMRASTRWRFALSLLGSVTSMFVLFVNPLVALPVAHLFHLSAAAGLGLVLVVSAVLLFISFRALIFAGFLHTYNTLFPVAAVRRYARGTAMVVTTALLLWGILINTELAFLAFIPLVPLLFAQPILRKHYRVSLENLL